MIYHLKTLTFFQEDFMASQPTHTAYIVIGAKKGGDKKANRREVGAVWPPKESNGFDR